MARRTDQPAALTVPGSGWPPPAQRSAGTGCPQPGRWLNTMATLPLSEPLSKALPVRRATGRLSPVSEDSSRLASGEQLAIDRHHLGRPDQQPITRPYLRDRNIGDVVGVGLHQVRNQALPPAVQ